MYVVQFLTSKKKLIVSLEVFFDGQERFKQGYDLTQVFSSYCKGRVKGGECIREHVQTTKEGLAVEFGYWFSESASLLPIIQRSLEELDRLEFSRTVDQFLKEEVPWAEEYQKRHPANTLELKQDRIELKEKKLEQEVAVLNDQLKELQARAKPVLTNRIIERLLVLVLIFLCGFAAGELLQLMRNSVSGKHGKIKPKKG